MEYNRALQQRASLLKDAAYHAALLDSLAVWDETLARLGSAVVHARIGYLKRLSALAQEFYRGISGKKEQISLSYLGAPDQQECEISRAKLEELLLERLKASRGEDLKTGFTSVGPHRDDLEILINSVSARQYGSQGQQRSAVLALKLAECEMIAQVTGEQPVVLLDDVMSELDSGRREYLLNRLTGRQVFITCCDAGYFKTLKNGLVVQMENGNLQARQCIENIFSDSKD